MADEVLDKAGVMLDEAGKPLLSEDGERGAQSPKVKEEELRRMSAFTEFINTLNLEDLGQNPQEGS